MALTKGQPMAVQICSRQICHSLAAYLQLQVVWVYIIFAPKRFKATFLYDKQILSISSFFSNKLSFLI
ncbi:hypothetical protein DU977_04305 [Vibrio cholerae]|nr:hypothetical protein [Vibrio cholerae]